MTSYVQPKCLFSGEKELFPAANGELLEQLKDQIMPLEQKCFKPCPNGNKPNFPGILSFRQWLNRMIAAPARAANQLRWPIFPECVAKGSRLTLGVWG